MLKITIGYRLEGSKHGSHLAIQAERTGNATVAECPVYWKKPEAQHGWSEVTMIGRAGGEVGLVRDGKEDNVEHWMPVK